MPFAFSFSSIAIPALPGVQFFRFFDLPTEIRYMVYEQLMDRVVPVKLPELPLPRYILEEKTEVLYCFYPAMMRVSRQLKEEYCFLVRQNLMMSTNWEICRSDMTREAVQSYQTSHPVLPWTVFRGLRYICLDVLMHDRIPRSSDGLLATIWKTICTTDDLYLFMFNAIYDIGQVVIESGLYDSTEFGKYGVWKRDMLDSLQNLVDDGNTRSATATFDILCALYCTLDENDIVPPVRFAVCNHPDAETANLDGLDIKLIDTDSDDYDDNTYTTLCKHEGEQ